MKRFNLLNIFLVILITLAPNQAFADIGGLTKCSDSPAFEKRLNTSVKKLEQRVAKYEAGTPPALALEQQIDRTKARFDKYSRSELLCGADGLPHLVADGRWSHAAEFILPGFGFIYISGWIGWVGRRPRREISEKQMVFSDFLYSSHGAKYKTSFKFAGELECNKPAPPIIASKFKISYITLTTPDEHIPARNAVNEVCMSIVNMIKVLLCEYIGNC